jgi:hypothetical protein
VSGATLACFRLFAGTVIGTLDRPSGLRGRRRETALSA